VLLLVQLLLSDCLEYVSGRALEELLLDLLLLPIHAT
jgi:hypothetical protein